MSRADALGGTWAASSQLAEGAVEIPANLHYLVVQPRVCRFPRRYFSEQIVVGEGLEMAFIGEDAFHHGTSFPKRSSTSFASL